MNNEQHLKISREFSRENRKINRFPGNFPGKTENLIVFPGIFPGKTKKLLFSREISRENRKIYHFPGKFPGKSEQIHSKLYWNSLDSVPPNQSSTLGDVNWKNNEKIYFNFFLTSILESVQSVGS